MQCRLHRADAHPEHLADLRLGEIVEEAQGDDGPATVRQRTQRSDDGRVEARGRSAK